jgi:hypothetical protein
MIPNNTDFESFMDFCLETNLKTIETINREIKKPTDLERFIDLYKSFGIELDAPVESDGELSVRLVVRDHEKITGYEGHYSWVNFDKETGKFLEQEIASY